jgi:EAL domain-containing protein (putative c-di-GMP-specific phosphodiesterase class I)/CHASE2 domain-containing sensor protein
VSTLRERLAAAWRNRRTRIVASALLLGALCGTFEVTLPLEDLFIAARTKLRTVQPSGSIVVVTIDDRTLERLHANDVGREDDAVVVERLISSGSKTIYFARNYPFSAAADGQALVTTLQRHPGAVAFGVGPKDGDARGTRLSQLPDRKFLEHANLVSLAALTHPLNMSYSLPFQTTTIAGEIPSLAAALGGKTGADDEWFRPDYAIDHHGIPTISYIDVLSGNFDRAQVAGKKIVIGRTTMIANEYHPLPLGEYVPNLYIHVLGGETLLKGKPVDVGWMPAFLLVAVMVVTGVGRGRSYKPIRRVGHGVILIVLPIILDRFSIELDVLPAAVMAVFATFRARALDKIKDVSETNAASGLPSLQALRSIEDCSNGFLVALKIRNYSGILRSFPEPVEAHLANEIQRRIRISEPEVVVYHEGGIFVWLSKLPDIVELFENLEGLHRIVQNGIVIQGTEVDVGFNCGIDSAREHSMPNRLASAMQSAEEAVRADELVVHHDIEKGEVQWEISLLASLDRAIDNGEVWVAFQPKLDLASNRIVGAEALARWTHPERGPISPEKFIGIAEEYHRIERITRFVLDKAVRAASALARDGHEFSVSVNISAQLLRNPRLPRMIADSLAAHDLAPERLVLEITETDRLERSNRTVQMMEALVASGLRISIDDFGTGNATIDYLRYLPASEVKIDKVFIRELEVSSADHLLVQSIIEMAHSLGRRVVAEGVESPESLALLRGLHCDEAQGYFISRPVPFQDLLTFLSSTPRRVFG